MLRLAAILTLLPAVALADITGTASVIDGDTIEIHGQRIRLFGIDAPESGQTCLRDGQPWRCGQQAGLALAEKIGRASVRCEERDRDRYGRIVAVCFTQGVDLNRWLVANGLAMAYRRFSLAYVDEEGAAQASRLGIWRGEFVPPWEWRGGKRLVAQDIPKPMDCPIKGNISSKSERIYHVPGGQYYDRTKIDTLKGERWFCSEEEAQAAGWRRARR